MIRLHGKPFQRKLGRFFLYSLSCFFTTELPSPTQTPKNNSGAFLTERAALFNHPPAAYFLRCGGRSVHTPSYNSAAMPIDSPSVGCRWIVLPISSASAPISIARHTSLIRSPAFVPTIPPPMIRCVSSSKMSLVKPSSRPFAIARPDAAHGNVALPYLMPSALHWSSVLPAHATSGSV